MRSEAAPVKDERRGESRATRYTAVVLALPPYNGAMSKRRDIYVNLLNEESASRRVLGERVGRNLCRLHGRVPAGEVWEFQPGQIVRCEVQTDHFGWTRAVVVEAIKIPDSK
jgi:hypothetical protein